jgi:PAS domain S-box-containing protein
MRSGEPYDVEFRARKRNGDPLWVRSIARMVRDPSGSARLRAAVLDVTHRRKAELAALENEERVRLLLDHAADALLVHDAEGRFVEVNHTACEALRFARAELVGMRVADIQVDFDEASALESWRSLEPGRSVTFDTEYRRRDGATFPVEVRIGLFEWSGRPHIVAIARDSSERKRLEQQLRHSQKMEAVGRLAGGVAHDFNNLLTAIKGHAELLIQEVPGDQQTQNDLMEITRAADRAAVLTRKLLAFSRQQIFAPEILDLTRIVLETSRLLRPLIGEHIDYQTDLEPIGPVRADHGQIEQVLVNLVVNARDAMSGGGQLVVKTRNLEVTPDRPDRHDFVRPGRYDVLSVTDTGHGMNADTLSRIFEPFFTTKEKGKGSGLGLAIAYGIVKQSGGYLIAESTPNMGATFLVVLPRSDAAPERERRLQPAVPSRPVGDGRVILVVEDEAPVRSLVSRVLAREGYSVLQAASGEEALQRIRDFDGPIDLVLTDVVMPGMDGRELATAVATRRPDARIVLMSGYSDELPRIEIDAGNIRILDKPFTPAELTRAVDEVLAG